MSTPSSAEVYTQGFGSKGFSGPIVATVAPSTQFLPSYHIGQLWVNSSANTVYVLTSTPTANGITTATWTAV